MGSQGMGCRRLVALVIAAACCVLACASNIPPVPPAPPLQAANGIRVLVYRGRAESVSDGAEYRVESADSFGNALVRALRSAGFDAIALDDSSARKPQVYDFGISYAKEVGGTRYGTWTLSIDMIASDLDNEHGRDWYESEHWSQASWVARNRAIREGGKIRNRLRRHGAEGAPQLCGRME